MHGDVCELALMHSCVIILKQTKSKLRGFINECRRYCIPGPPRVLRQRNMTRMQEDRVLTAESVRINNADGVKMSSIVRGKNYLFGLRS